MTNLQSPPAHPTNPQGGPAYGHPEAPYGQQQPAYGHPQAPFGQPYGAQPMTSAEMAWHAKAAKAHAESLRPWFKKKRFVIPLGIVALSVVGNVANGGTSTAPSSSTPAIVAPQAEAGVADKVPAKAAKAAKPTEAAKPAQPAKPAEVAKPAIAPAATIGSKVTSGDFTVVITKVRTGVKSVGNAYVGEKAQGQYVLINIKATNEGDKARYLTGGDVTLLDAKGREFSVDSMASIYVSDNNPLLEEINPGNTSKGTLVFDLPKGVKATQAQISAGGLFDGPTTVDLTS